MNGTLAACSGLSACSFSEAACLLVNSIRLLNGTQILASGFWSSQSPWTCVLRWPQTRESSGDEIGSRREPTDTFLIFFVWVNCYIYLGEKHKTLVSKKLFRSKGDTTEWFRIAFTDNVRFAFMFSRKFATKIRIVPAFDVSSKLLNFIEKRTTANGKWRKNMATWSFLLFAVK